MSPEDSSHYRLLDSGHGRRLEALGPILVDRQAPAAFWAPRLPSKAWARAQAFHHRSKTGGGHWEQRSRLPDRWWVQIGRLVMETRLTPFGHVGFFAEQADQWDWLREAASLGEAPLSVLNLFAYTGGSTLALAQAGAEVCHVDAASGIVDWARKNAAQAGLEDRPIRWIVDDVLAFLHRESRRGRRYQGIVMDPPSYGRGPRKEVFKIEEAMGDLLEACARVLDPEPRLFLLSCHTPGFTPRVLENLLRPLLPEEGYRWHSGEMEIREEDSPRSLPSGAFCRVVRTPPW